MYVHDGRRQDPQARFQVADVHKPLLSTSKVADAGYECHLNNKGGFLLDTYTGEQVHIPCMGSLYFMSAWVKEDKTMGFSRPE